MRNKMLFRKERILFYTLLAVLFVWALFRISKGVPWKGEAYYAALAKRLLSGQKPFSQVWSLHITSSLLIVPFIKLYEILPRFIGLLLFLRAITVVITFMGAIYINLALKKITNAFLSDGIAFCIAIYMPCGIAALSYNVLGLLFATLTAAACIFCNQEWKWYHALCGGMFFALAVQSYPTAIFLGLPILVFLIAKCKKLKITFFLAFAGAVSVCLAFLWCVLSTVTFPELFSNIQFCLSDPDHVTPLFLQHIKDYLYQFKRWYGLPYMAVCILLTFVGMGNFALRRAKKQKQASSIKTRFEKIFLLSWGITALYGILYTPHTEHITSFKMVPLFLLGPALALFFSNFRYELGNGLRHQALCRIRFRYDAEMAAGGDINVQRLFSPKLYPFFLPHFRYLAVKAFLGRLQTHAQCQSFSTKPPVSHDHLRGDGLVNRWFASGKAVSSKAILHHGLRLGILLVLSVEGLK